MAIDRTGKHWRGENDEDLAERVRAFQAGGFPVGEIRHPSCPKCQGREFGVLVDDVEGCAVAVCLSCTAETPLLDSADYLEDAELGECACPCGGETFAVALGYSLLADGEVRWVSVGLRCLADGVLGVYTDWKIDYVPSTHLLEVR